LGDATGATWKNNFGMRAVDAATGAACSVRQSVLRNAPWVLTPAIKVLAQQLFEPDMVEARALRGVAGLLGLTLTVLMGATGEVSAPPPPHATSSDAAARETHKALR
jgi:hypothetical protein